jgi:hypothetical protein
MTLQTTAVLDSASKKVVIGLFLVFLMISGMSPASAIAEPLADYHCPRERFGAADSFGICNFDGRLQSSPSGGTFAQAGGVPYSLTTNVALNTRKKSGEGPFGPFEIAVPVEPPKDILVDVPPGMVANPAAVGVCTADQLLFDSLYKQELGPTCPSASQVGVITVFLEGVFGAVGPNTVPLFSMAPPPGIPARFGFNIARHLISLDARLRTNDEYAFAIDSLNISQGLSVVGASVTFWGVPAAATHDGERACPGQSIPPVGPSCAAGVASAPLLRVSTSCSRPQQGLPWNLHVDSWWHRASFDADHSPGLADPSWRSAGYESHLRPGYPDDPDPEGFPGLFPDEGWGLPKGIEGCDIVPVKGDIDAKATSHDAETPSGLDVAISVPNPGLENPNALTSTSDIKKAVVSLPQGVTINPSQAEGLGVCTPSQYERTELSFHPDPNRGCPSDSKIGTVSVETPLLDETLSGEVFIAQQDDPKTTQHGTENPFDSLLALYIVIKSPERGILVKLPGKVEPDEKSGRIVTTFDDLPQIPFSSFKFKFREGARAPLVTPPTCGTYTTEAEFAGWSSVAPETGAVDPEDMVHSSSTFQITGGIGGSPCPPQGIPPFKPGFTAGSLNNNAASYTPFLMRLTRQDGEQDMTKFSSILPPGVVGKLAGVSKCPDSAIAIAKSKTGREEIANPSCPANSQIGRILAGAGVGSVLTYVPGKVYLGGPVGGDPLSVIVITPAVAGPFDVGTVVVREALTLNPDTAEVEVDGKVSDPIPHILEGIPLKLRDLRVYVDRDNFILNPTSCDPSSVKATLFGSYLDVFNPSDDVPVDLASRFQAANCSALGFKPRLALKLKGGTKRGGHPGLTATYRPRSGDANAEGIVVRLPRSAFLDQSHIRTICTRVQFAADACPKGSRYGYIKATTPLLDEPLQGPVYLRSSNHKLPDLLFDLHGLVDIEVATRIDSIKGGVRASVDQIPDAPISKVVLRMQGAKKGLIINSRDLCASTNRANAQFTGQNGKEFQARPELRPGGCAGKGRRR